MLNLLFVSTPVGPLGSGLGGGVELTLANLARELQNRSHRVVTIAPQGSAIASLEILQVPGQLQPIAQSQGRDAPIVLPANSVLGQMWHKAYSQHQQYDLLLNFAYDWLPFYLTPLFQRPIAHLVSMGSLTDAMDSAIGSVASAYPGTIGVHSLAQAATFSFADTCISLANGLDMSCYDYCAEPEPYLGWVGRIAPEKGLEDAIAAAQRIDIPLKIWGAMPDRDYWQAICDRHPAAPIHYEGFLSTQALQTGLRRCRALLMTPHWVEAFGNVAIEALACGVPVIAYRRGGPAEIVSHGKTGWLVEPDDIDGLVRAIAQLHQIDRAECRQQAELYYSMQAMGDRVEAWFHDILNRYPYDR